MDKIRVLIVDDSIFFRTALQKILMNDNSIEIIGTAGSALDADRKISELSPDVVTLDVEMPNMSGTDFLKKLIPVKPIPVILVSSLNVGAFDALSAGAVDFVRKPASNSGPDFVAFCNELKGKIKIAKNAKVRQPRAAAPVTKTATSATNTIKNLASGAVKRHVIAIGASTGGTEATSDVLKDLPENIPGIIIVQHMPVGFTKMYAERLDRTSKIKVVEAVDGERVEQGKAIVAAGDKHMTLAKDSKGYYVKCQAGDKVSGHCPSVDVMFESVAKTAGKDAIGVILTGMGRDGARGLLHMRQNGAFTIGQDEKSCVVYGMPMVAFELGGVCEQASCSAIAGRLVKKIGE
ncbi:MAG: chemotaxis response regulator protein-glutamate methylesterase [Clostridiales bacterium]|nr:chemotaxis response regulator protein-glutamate methylesterase [Clostridiales bacterium]